MHKFITEDLNVLDSVQKIFRTSRKILWLILQFSKADLNVLKLSFSTPLKNHCSRQSVLLNYVHKTESRGVSWLTIDLFSFTWMVWYIAVWKDCFIMLQKHWLYSIVRLSWFKLLMIKTWCRSILAGQSLISLISIKPKQTQRKKCKREHTSGENRIRATVNKLKMN